MRPLKHCFLTQKISSNCSKIKKTHRGFILISVTILSFLLLSIAGLIFYKTIYVDNLNKSWLQRRVLFLEIDSILIELQQRLASLSPKQVAVEIENFLPLSVDKKQRWKIHKRAQDVSGDPIIFDFYYVPKKLYFRRVLLYNP